MRRYLIISGVVLLAVSLRVFSQSPASDTMAHTLTATNAADAWQELRASVKPPSAPAEWNIMPPSREERKNFYVPFVLSVADRAHDFAVKFPNDSHALDARMSELDFYSIAINLGDTNVEAKSDALAKKLLSDPTLPEADRFHIRQHQVEQAVQIATDTQNQAAALDVYEKGVRQLQKEFPHNPEVLQMLLTLAPNLAAPKAKAILQEVASNPEASPQMKEFAADQLKTFARVGKPIELQFTSVDGRPVNLAKMKGNVVLLDFWATWCNPCVHEVPAVKAAYDQLHHRGFDIVGISLDKNKDALTSFVAAHQMPWPQYFDGLQWSNKVAQEYAIESIPAMWLVDKNGVLRDVNAREDLTNKVEKLLSE